MCLNNDIISLEEGGCSNMKKERDLIQETKDLGIIDVKFSGEGSSKIKATENLYDSIKPEVCNKFYCNLYLVFRKVFTPAIRFSHKVIMLRVSFCRKSFSENNLLRFATNLLQTSG